MICSYPVIVHPVEGGAFWIELPDFPEATTRGRFGIDDPAKDAADLLETAIQFRKFDGRSIPLPTPATDLPIRPNGQHIVVAIDPDTIQAPDSVVPVLCSEGKNGAQALEAAIQANLRETTARVLASLTPLKERELRLLLEDSAGSSVPRARGREAPRRLPDAAAKKAESF